MVESVVHIAGVMGIKTVAEFVEDEAVLARLKEIGVTFRPKDFKNQVKR